jgi:hypothetical protein
MEIDQKTGLYIYPDVEIDRKEGAEVEALRAKSQQPIQKSSMNKMGSSFRLILIARYDAMFSHPCR